ncbi:hypothetical protein LLB_0560 [Legionella longbeachae D-4968]|nr:hypothetical protein LLB_0560 [Legionella longbeachae D-4968]
MKIASRNFWLTLFLIPMTGFTMSLYRFSTHDIRWIDDRVLN